MNLIVIDETLPKDALRYEELLNHPEAVRRDTSTHTCEYRLGNRLYTCVKTYGWSVYMVAQA